MTLSYRIGLLQYTADDQFQRLLDLLRAHRPIVDEIALFTSFTHHLYRPLNEVAELAELIRQRLGQLRKAGIPSVGINVLCTLGHLDEAWDFLEPLPFDPMISHDGTTSRSCACPTSPELRQYVNDVYQLMAQAKPDFIWIDDDIRMQHHTAAWPCFCKRCLELFARKQPGAPTRRQAMVKLLESPAGGEMRRTWVQNNEDVLNDVLKVVQKAVHQVDRKIATGLMTASPGWSGYSGQDYVRWLSTLKATKARPGGGFYDDACPRHMILKAIDTGRQCVMYGGVAKDTQYELENFPYHKLDKAVQTVLNECTLALAAGCNGIAFNALNDMAQSMDGYRDLMAGIERQRPVWDQFLQAAGELPLAGLWQAWDRHVTAWRRPANGNWFSGDMDFDFNKSLQLTEIGLPLAVAQEASCATVLTGRLAELYSDRQLRQMLSGGVILDVETLKVLHGRKLSHLTGVRPGKSYDNGVWETLSPHPFNGRYAGDARDVRISFWPQPAQALEPLSSDVHDLGRLTGYDYSDCGCCMTAFENGLGGRVVTSGYAPWTRLAGTSKRWQMLEVADWVSRSRLPLRIDKALRVTPMVRMGQDRKHLAAVLLNASIDPTGPFQLRLRAKVKAASLVTPKGLQALPAKKQGDELVVNVKGIAPWQTAVIIGK